MRIHIDDFGVFGFFWGIDEFDQTYLNTHGGSSLKTNNAEIIYVDSHFTDYAPSAMYSTLVHEFQHLINFNQKTTTSSAWFNEMLSMLAEDLISPMIGIPISDSGHPILGRMPRNLNYYDSFPAYGEWSNTSPDDYNAYSNVYAFGAYLVRNYGGPELVRAFATNSFNDENAISNALASQVNPLRSTVFTIAEAFNRYGEAFVYSGAAIPSSVTSFNKTVSSTTISPGLTYTYQGFDIAAISRGSYGGNAIYGPYTTPATNSVDPIARRSLLVKSLPEWRSGINGDLKIELININSNVDHYIMIK